MKHIDIIITIVCSVLGSGGLWTFLQFVAEKKSARSKMILGLGHDRIITLCQEYIERGYITPDEYENLHKYLYTPYKELGGNGTAERLMTQVMKLPNSPQGER